MLGCEQSRAARPESGQWRATACGRVLLANGLVIRDFAFRLPALRCNAAVLQSGPTCSPFHIRGAPGNRLPGLAVNGIVNKCFRADGRIDVDAAGPSIFLVDDEGLHAKGGT